MVIDNHYKFKIVSIFNSNICFIMFNSSNFYKYLSIKFDALDSVEKLSSDLLIPKWIAFILPVKYLQTFT